MTHKKSDKPFAPPLPEFFRCKRVTIPDGPPGGHWALKCRRCGKKWSLRVQAQISAGNILHLLDHAHSHDKDAADDEESTVTP